MILTDEQKIAEILWSYIPDEILEKMANLFATRTVQLLEANKETHLVSQREEWSRAEAIEYLGINTRTMTRYKKYLNLSPRSTERKQFYYADEIKNLKRKKSAANNDSRKGTEIVRPLS